MTSSVMTGERRWASARRGGMTVLGKVAAPKPINLPSQKLENHGLDPNVDIVPKGTISWGSRTSTSASNPWGSSTQSPKANGSTGSPSHLSGRPSSGGSGTRPSTGSSDRAHEPIANAWSSNSRPSSASGVLSSNQASTTSSWPRSVETRSSSSQLSRFAEPLSESSEAWGTAGTEEKLGDTSSKKDGFSLASGDFPTLGSEKDNAGKNMESQDLSSHGRPGSSSGGVAPVKDIIGAVSINSNTKSEDVNTWRRDNNPYGEDGVRYSVEKWQADPQGPHPYPNACVPPQHYEAWHGPPINNHPRGVWYRGPPRGPPFGSSVPHGGFPMEPFHFYRPQIHASALAIPQPIPPLGAGPRVHHPKNGDMYRHPMPDAYMHPGMHMRPGFYPGPVAYESYYGPPMGYRNSNERDVPVPFMGMAAGPHSYNRYSGQSAHDAGNSQSRSSACCPNGKALASEQVEPGHFHDARGPYRVLLKQQDGWEGKDKEQKWEETVTANASRVQKGDQRKLSSWENDWTEDYKKDEQIGLKRKGFGEEAFYQVSDREGHSSSMLDKVKSSENMGNAKVVDNVSVQKVEHVATAFPEIPAAPKDSSLIQKIEGLNAKARASDGRHDLMSASSREEQKTTSQIIADSDEDTTGSLHIGKNHSTGTDNPAAYEGNVTAGNKRVESTAASGPVISRRSTHGMHGRTVLRGKGRFSYQEVDGWQRKSPVTDSSTDVSAAHSEGSYIPIQDHPAKVITENSEFYPYGNDYGVSVPALLEPSDGQAQRAKMKEPPKQLVKQRQEEEEERARGQKAKALAKLEELNRRTQAMEGLTLKSEVISNVAIQNKKEESQSTAESTVVASKSGTSSSVLVSKLNDAAQISESGATSLENSTVLSNEKLRETPKSGLKESVRMHKHNEYVTLQQNVNDSDVHRSNAPQVYDGGASKQKRFSYKQKQNIPSAKNSSEKFLAASATEPLKGHNDLIVNSAASHKVIANQISPNCEASPTVPNVVAQSSIQQRGRSSRGGKKHKVEVASSGATLPYMVSTETNVLNNNSAESSETKASESEVDASSVQEPVDAKDASQTSELRVSSPSEENHVRENNQWKSQNSLRMSRSVQTKKSAEKFRTNEAVIWAPVRTQNKAEVTDEASHKSFVDALSVKSDNQVQNNSRNKRAEMERYIPMHVVKEMAQPGSGQQPAVAPSISKTVSDEIDGKADSGSQGAEGSRHAGYTNGKKGVVMESTNGDHRQNKQGKVHGSWRQWPSSESTVVQGLQDAQPSNTCRNVRKPVEHQRTQKPEVRSVKYSDEWSSDDGWNLPENPDLVLQVNVPVVKDQGVTAREWHQFKGHKGTGNNGDHDHNKTNSGDGDKIYMQSSVPIPETSQTDLSSSSKENPATGYRSTSHWQPKPQAYVPSGIRPNSGPNVGAEVGMSNKKDSSPQGGRPLLAKPSKDTNERVAQEHGHSASILSKADATSNVGHQEPKRERKIASAKGRPDSPNQGTGSLVENAPPSNIVIRNEQRMPSGFRRNRNQNSHFNSGHESHGDWSSSGQDNKQHSKPINRERRHNAHYVYQPVGPYNNNIGNNFEGLKDAPTNGGGKYSERGQSHSRRGGGNYHGKSSGSV